MLRGGKGEGTAARSSAAPRGEDYLQGSKIGTGVGRALCVYVVWGGW